MFKIHWTCQKSSWIKRSEIRARTFKKNVYNDKEIFIKKKKEKKALKRLKKQLKGFYSQDIKKKNKIKKATKKKDLKYLSLGRALAITEGPTRSKAERDERIKEIDEKINYISKMSIREYLNYSRDKERKKADRNDEENSVSTIDEIIEERLKKLETIVTINKKIKCDLKVKF